LGKSADEKVSLTVLAWIGINVVAYYSTEIFLAAHFSEKSALVASLGFGVINFLFALPAFWTIDTFGRRNLLLATFPVSSTTPIPLPR